MPILRRLQATWARNVESSRFLRKNYESLLPRAQYLLCFQYLHWYYSCPNHLRLKMATLSMGDAAVLPEKSKKQPSQISFRSGETVPVSGIWRPDHGQPSHSEELWLRVQTSFPPCPRCGLATRFILMEEIRHISEDPDFQ
jgi:hypothetical protein